MFEFTNKPKVNHTQRVKDLVRNTWGIDDNVVIMVSELKCHEDGCPDVETVIALMPEDQNPTKIKIASPIAEVDSNTIKKHKPK
ncbi:MAG: nitrate reductase [Pseudomonadota bacterium]|nr:nitrate reductase [Pseudomonadota bacterium]